MARYSSTVARANRAWPTYNFHWPQPHLPFSSLEAHSLWLRRERKGAFLISSTYQRKVRRCCSRPSYLKGVGKTREQLAEAERLKSGLEDLQGLRRGKVRVACSQAVAPEFMPRAIGVFRGLYPMVDFDVRVVDHEQAATALASYDVDLALVFSPDSLPGFERLALLEQRLVALMPREHVLCEKPELRLRDCAGHSLALPDRSTGGRQLLDSFSARTGITFEVAIESNSFEFLRGSVVQSGLVSFQIDVGAPAADADSDIIVRKIDRRDAPPANLVLGKLPGRNLPQICLIFAEYVMDRMALMRDGRAPFENTAD